jgi:hypothetical protein
MSEEDFLSRWSRRKREVAVTEERAEKTAAKPAEESNSKTEIAPNSTDEKPNIDLSVLPPIESITAASDVTAFLRAGVPVELTRAALRRVWTADPAIRDFVGLAENAWDFNAPDTIPGFGPLDMTDDLRQQVAEILGEKIETAKALNDDTSASECESVQTASLSSDVAPEIANRDEALPLSESANALSHDDDSRERDAAQQRVNVATREDIPTDSTPTPRGQGRSHGRALPQ